MTDARAAMTPERWERVKSLFQATLERPPAERTAFLASACGGDASLQEDVARLLESHDEAGSFIESPAVDLVRGHAPEAPVTGTVGPQSPAPRTPSAKAGLSGPKTFAADEVVAGRYRILRFIAEGGMGEVYEAEDLALHGKVALKTIRAEIAADARALERFKREIHVARKVTHPNVCRIYDLGAHRPLAPEGAEPSADVLFLTMELLTGETLSERIAKSGRLGTGEALRIVTQIAAALDAAHAAGIIHRDFKSANVVLAPDPRTGPRAVVTDFGLARATTSDASVASISDSGAVVGTPAYMAPEQVQGQELTPAADLYALGIVMYEMVTGVRPFDGGSAITVAVKRLTEAPPPPHNYVSDLDPTWESVILRCLERDPKARFATASEVVAALPGGWKMSSSGVAAPQGTSSIVVPSTRLAPVTGRPSRRVVAVGAAAIALAAAAGYVFWHGRAPTTTASPPPVAPSVTPRRAVAVLGFKNLSGRPDAAWLSTAISEMLTTDLAAGGTVRVLSGQEVSRVRRELGLGDVEDLAKDALAKARQNLGADLFVLGSYTVLEGGLLRIDARLVDASTEAVIVPAKASGTSQQLFDLVTRAAQPLREKLGAGAVTPEQALEVEASLPSNPEAARFYSEGLEKLRVRDALAARTALEKAVAADPKHPLPHAALASAWAALGYEAKAREEAEKAVALAGKLTPEDKLAIEARLSEISDDWEKAIEGYRSLFAESPDNLEHGLALAEAQTSGGRAKEALVTIQALRKLLGSQSDDPRIDLAAARAFMGLADFRRAQAAADKAATKASARGARLIVARARLVEASALDKLGEPTRSADAAEEARRLYEAAGDKGGVAQSLNRMALSLDGQGDKEGARRLYERSLAINRETGDRDAVGWSMINLGTVLFELGDVSGAQKLYDEALATVRQIGGKYLVASVLNDIGARLHSRGDLAGARKHYQEALTTFGEIGQKSGVATTLTNLAEVLYVRGDLKQAQEMHEESLAICREIGDKDVAAYGLYRLGEVFAAKGDLRVAQGRYEEALSLQKQLGDKMAQAQTRLGMAAVANAEARFAEGESIAREAEEILRAGGAADMAALAQAILAEALLGLGRAAEAAKAVEAARATAAQSEDRHVRLAVATSAARVRAASGTPQDVAAALASLEKARAEAAKAGFVKDQYEAALALGEIELAAGRGAAGRARLQALAKETGAKGFGLLARRAEKASKAGQAG